VFAFHRERVAARTAARRSVASRDL